MNHQHLSSRRRFLQLGVGLALGLGGLGLHRPARAAQLSDYKALVCIYLYGGNDGNNVIVPMDSARYGAYQSLRGGLALSGNKLLPPITDANGNPYALHYGLPELNSIYGEGALAFVLNTGMLQRPLTRAEVIQGQGLPTNLFSHSDQTMQAQTGLPTINGTGWGGRLLDGFDTPDSLAAISLSSPALFLQGFDAGGNVIPPGTNLGLSGLSFWPQSAADVRRQALNNILLQDGGNLVRQAANKKIAEGLILSDALKSGGNLTPLTTVFPGTSLGNQLKEALRLIRLRAQQGPGRQVFFCSLDGFDLHSSQDWNHWYLLSTLSQALAAFYDATQEAGLADQVTSFTQSEFGRTLQPSGSGSDHAWGNHHLVLGGAVRGGIYGQIPTLALAGPDDANNRGVWIPKIATAQFGATLGRWFGATDAELALAFPNLAQFPSSDIGFML